MPSIYPAPTSAQTQATQKFDHLVNNMPGILLRVSSVFPLDMLPTQVTIEKTKINVKTPIFIASEEVKTILISEVSHVEMTTSLWFASLKIVSVLPMVQPYVVKHLWKKDALQVQDIVQGLTVGFHEEVDLSEVPAAHLKRDAEQIGRTPPSV